MYGSRETGNTSCECSAHNGRHIAMETSLVEFVNDNKPVEYGETGEILITDLTNFAFPLIRYRINDYGVPQDKRCSCGRNLKLMSSAVGRVQDDIYSADGTRMSGLTFSVHLLTAFDRPIGQLQVVQKSYTDFVVRIKDKPEPTRETMDFIRSQMHKILGEAITIDIQVVREIPHEKSGKTRFVICEVPVKR
jgi:phenylacetate-CoA ligase